MAIIDEKSLNGSPSEDGGRNLAEAFSGTKAKLPGLNAVRRPTGQVVDILRRANNFFATGDAGLIAIGITKGARAMIPEIGGEPNPDYNPSAVLDTVPQIAEVAALLTCSEEEVDACDDDIKQLKKLRRKITKKLSSFEIAELLEPISEEFDKINAGSAVVPESEDTEPESLVDAKKKHSPAGALATP